jgi:ubiquinone/menaquinone biosynthesis C-methylase UbiE
MGALPQPAQSYLMGYTDQELHRLLLQGRILNPITERMLRTAGLAPGMRVLDVGCGPGDVTLLAAKIVGPDGSVTGFDRDERALALGEKRAAADGCENVKFVRGEVTEARFHSHFDAIVGRLILVHIPDKLAALSHLLKLVRPGGLVAFIDLELGTTGDSLPYIPLFTQVIEWTYAACRAGGMDPYMGRSMYSLFQQAGLPAPSLTLERPISGGADSPIPEWLGETLRTLRPACQKAGLFAPDDATIDQMILTMKQQAGERQAVMVGATMVCAWARKPVR